MHINSYTKNSKFEYTLYIHNNNNNIIFNIVKYCINYLIYSHRIKIQF